MFEKGHKGYKKPYKYKQSRKKRDKYGTLDVMPYKKEWDKNTSKKMVDPLQAEYYIYNNLPLDDLYEDIRYYKKEKNGNEGM